MSFTVLQVDPLNTSNYFLYLQVELCGKRIATG